ncbi:PAN 1 domain containing protein [Trichuris trichiura]|uniref:PAN 1 domain containing protein n=1 Tax=Trichuris trichiura TaxID=36087 RepID=A0A077ZAR2_TRITR|nr:PAN 1 domain containing protein [Trichuris trichiura]
MFAHRGDVAPAILVPTPQHDYYEVISDKCRKSNRLDIFSWTTSKPAANVSSSAYLDEVKRNLVSHCSKIILREPKKILIGYARTVVEIKSSRECIEQCLKAPSLYGYTCSSGVFYNEENSLNCILNSETKEQHADLLVEDQQNDVEYFQLLCGDAHLNSHSANHEMAKPESNGNAHEVEKSSQRISNAVIIAKEIANGWTIWSPCETGTNIRKRYQVCDQFDIRNCPQEMEYCKGDINSAQQNLVHG